MESKEKDFCPLCGDWCGECVCCDNKNKLETEKSLIEKYPEINWEEINV